MKLAQLSSIDMELENLQMKRTMIQTELANLRSGEEVVKISKEKFWNTIERRAAVYMEHESVYTSYSGKSAYSIFNLVKDKIFNDDLLKPVYTRSEPESYYSFKSGNYTFNRMITNSPIEQPFHNERFNIKPANMLTTRPGFGIQQNWLEEPRSLNSRNLRHSN